MPIQFWILLWQVLLIVALGLFTALAIVVTIGGAIDIRRLLKTLRDEHARSVAENAEGSDATPR
jgi:hypothetical protein